MYQNPHFPPGYEDDEEAMTPEEFERQQYYQQQYHRQQQYRQQQLPPVRQPVSATGLKALSLQQWLLIALVLIPVWWLFGSSAQKTYVINKVPVHLDTTEIKPAVSRQVENTVPLVYTNKDGKLQRVLANADAYSEFVRVHSGNLEQARKRLHTQAEANLTQRLDEVFNQMNDRVARFADWYFAYSTGYTLLWEALSSAGRHFNEDYPFKDAVAQDLEDYLQVHYQTIVMKPEITDPQLQRAYTQTLENSHQAYLSILSVMEGDFKMFVAKHTTHVDAFHPADLSQALNLDWQAQFSKVVAADYARTPLGVIRGITLATAGAIAGKKLGQELGKTLFPKLVTPFVNKAVAVGASGTVGGAVGTIGGPAGSVIGAGIGIGAGLSLDWLINEGIELVNRGDFVADAKSAVQTTRNEWQDSIQQGLLSSIDVWFNDTIQLLPKYSKP